jgi:ABC-2 type transport system permease protein
MAEKGTAKMNFQKIKQFFTSLPSLFSSSAESKRGNLALIIVVIILINMVGSFLYFKIDLTLNDVYSLSRESRDTMKNLEEPLKIKVFFSDNLPAPYNTVQRYMYDLMAEYNSTGGSNVDIEYVDVEKEDGKALATSFGISPVQVREVSGDQVSARSAFMGLVFINGDIVEKINGINSPEGLEYKITSTVRKMVAKSSALLKLKAPIKMTLYLSPTLLKFQIQGIDKVEQAVRTSADKVKRNNFGKVDFSVVDPGTGKEFTDLAAKYNLPKFNWKTTPTQSGVVPAGEGVASIVIESGKSFQVVRIDVAQTMFGNAVSGLQNIEEKLNNAIGAVLTSSLPVAYATGHGEQPTTEEQQGGPSSLKKVLSDTYDMKEIDLTKEDLPEGIKTLVVNGPKARFTDEELFKIDQFIMRGGNVAFYIDSFNEMRGENPYMPPNYVPIDTGLEKILSPLGISINKDVILDKKCVIRRGEGNDMTYYHVPQLEKNSLSGKNVITKYLKTLTYVIASSINVDDKIAKQNGLDSQVLITSSSDAWKMQGRIMINPSTMTPPADEKEYAKFNFAVLVEGKFKSAFNGIKPAPVIDPKKPAEKKAESITEAQPLRESAATGKIFVTSSSLINMFDPEGKLPNAVYFMNIIDYMNGNIKTQEMRSKGIAYNPLDTTKPLTRDIIKFGNMFGVPLIGIGAGLFMWRRRLIRRKKIQNYFSKGGSL